jgi:hypothetical protein
MVTLPVLVEPVSSPDPGTLGPGATFGSKLAAIDVDRLRRSIGELTGGVAALFEDIETVGHYRLKEVQVSLEITAEGGVALIGSLKTGRGAGSR